MTSVLSKIVTKIKQGSSKVWTAVKKLTSTVVDKSLGFGAKIVGSAANVVGKVVVTPIVKAVAPIIAVGYAGVKQSLNEIQNNPSPIKKTSASNEILGLSPTMLALLAGGLAVVFLI